MSTNLFKVLTIKEIIEEVNGFKSFVFEDEPRIDYKAGQYLTLVHKANNEEIRRSYSITSSPFLNESLSIGVKRIENGFFSRELVDKAKVGDKLTTIGAGGLFILPENIYDYDRIFLFAAGSGITPEYSILKSALHAYKHLKVYLIYSTPSLERSVFYESLFNLQIKYPDNFLIRFIFSNSSDLKKAHLHRDLLEELLKFYSTENQSTSLFYICGPESYMRMCTYVLQENGIDPDNIKRENFVIQKPAKVNRIPTDIDPHLVKVKFQGIQHNITVKYPDTILQSAKKSGLILPYSCEVGRCGNCIARCIEGKVWLSYNEVLTEKELNKGLTLTCVGHPVGGDVTLEI